MSATQLFPEYLTAALPPPHGFFTRRGGVSTGAFSSLNCSVSGHDAPEAVLENRARAAHAMGADPKNLLGLIQVHGSTCVTATTRWDLKSRPTGDAIVTDRPGLALAIVTADCAPVLFADPHTGIVGAAHAGWRGAVAGVLEATLDAMVTLGAIRSNIVAAIGPCIQAASYEVTADLRDPVLAREPTNAEFFTTGRDSCHWQFDLPGYASSRLRRAGLTAVRQLDADTLTQSDLFFSHRRRTLAGGGAIGHQISIIRCPS
jgi:YfiH family protein